MAGSTWGHGPRTMAASKTYDVREMEALESQADGTMSRASLPPAHAKF